MSIRTLGNRVGTLSDRVHVVRGDAPDMVVRTRGRKWMRICADMARREPFCRVCMARGIQSVGRQTDHIVPLWQGGTDDESNLQRLCMDCHDEKSQREEKVRLRAYTTHGGA